MPSPAARYSASEAEKLDRLNVRGQRRRTEYKLDLLRRHPVEPLARERGAEGTGKIASFNMFVVQISWQRKR